MARNDGTISAKGLILQTFKPQVAMLCSPAAQALCEKNNLKFTQLVQPFSTLTTDLSWQEPYGQNVSPKGLRICPVDLSSWKPSEQDSTKNRRILNNLVSRTPPPLPLLTDDKDNDLLHVEKLNGRSYNYSVKLPKSAPWYEQWRETFLRFHSDQQQSQHEFLNQFIACILVISASEAKSAEDLSTMLGKLSKLQLQHQHEWPQTWFLSSSLKFYLILHDCSTDNPMSSEGAYQSLRTTYGANFCYMLKINSRGPDSDEPPINDVWTQVIQRDKETRLDIVNTDPNSDLFEEAEPVNPEEPFHPLSPSSEYPPPLQTANGEIKSNANENSVQRGLYFTNQDLQNVQIAINEFIGKSLLPYVERQAKTMHESILNRRGMSKSIFNATKRLFSASAKTASSMVYTSESPEMLSRKLADLYFLFGHYAGAYQLYHQIKKDFQADSAWIYYASSLEMAALSHFMMTQCEPPMAVTRSFPVHYITEAISHYIDFCRLPDAATRCAIICCECLKQIGNLGEAAAIFIRMTSEECDLRSALMLEQAAYSFVKLNSPRKYALHSVLAGHRYAKAGLRSHSLNCYLQAIQIYSGRGWRFAEDHVQFTIARHQACLQICHGLTKRLLTLLKTPTVQSVGQIQTFYKEFITVAAKLYEDDPVAQEVFIPTVQCSNIRILIATTGLQTGEISNQLFNQEKAEAPNWDGLEEQVVRECVDNSVIIFKPSRLMFDYSTDNTVHPSAPCNETFYIEIPFLNPLSTELVLRNIGIKFDNAEAVASTVVDSLSLQPGEVKTLRFGASCSAKGMISFDWIFYELELGSTRVPFVQKLNMKGPRLNSTQVERCGRVYAKDLRNKINIVGDMPLLTAEIENLPSSLFHSQWTEFNLVLKDKSKDPKQRERLPRVVIASENMSQCLEVRTPSTTSNELRLESIHKNYCSLRVVLDGSSVVRIPCLYKVPPAGEMTTLNILILYEIEPEETPVLPSFSPFGSVIYRVIKISIKIPLLNSLRLEHSCLKKLSSQKSVNLLKVQNLTKDKTVTLRDMTFDPPLVAIDGITWGSGNESLNKKNDQAKEEPMLKLEPTQSCNIIFRTRAVDNNSIKSRAGTENEEGSKGNFVILNVKWQIYQDVNGVNSENNNEISVAGFHQVHVPRKDILSSSDESVVFQLRHKTRGSHDFYKSPCFLCPVELVLNNQKPGKLIVKIERDSNRRNETSIQSSSRSSSSQAVYFVGKTSWTIDTSVESNQDKEEDGSQQGKENEGPNQNKLIYNVALTRPGVYNVAPVISLKRPDDGTHQTYDLHSPFIVDQI